MNQKKMKRIIQTAAVFCFAAILAFRPELLVYAAEKKDEMSTVTAKFDTLKDLVASIVSGIGVIISLWGISEFGMAMQGNDGMMQSHSFKRIAGGLIMVLAPQILTILT